MVISRWCVSSARRHFQDDASNPADPERLAAIVNNDTDIEHAPVLHDDPRQWSKCRKTFILAVVSFASLITTQAANIQNPGVTHIEAELHASPSEISWSLSLFILLQGTFPILWSAVSEVKGRKLVYLASVALFTLGSAVVAIAKNMGVVIGMRCVQGAGGSAVFAIGAATLADIYAPSERGTMMGLYHSAPSLGRALAPLLGGALTQGFSWRAIYWDLVIIGGFISLCFLLFYKDTFRRERSIIYRLAPRRCITQNNSSLPKSCVTPPQLPTLTFPEPILLSDVSHSNRVSLVTTGIVEWRQSCQYAIHGIQKQSTRNASEDNLQASEIDEKESKETVTHIAPIDSIPLSFRDVNPITPLWVVLRRLNNITVLITSGLIFGFFYSISYTTGRTLGRVYGYNSIEIGLVLFSYGVGSVTGSIIGGRWSDRVLARLKSANGGVSYPEMRLEGTKLPMLFLPMSVAGYAWICQQHVYVAAICTTLFLSGFFSMWTYASTLAYIVDANSGRSSTAVSAELAFRGIAAFVAAEVAIPLQDTIGDGWLYTIWALLLVVGELLVFMTMWRGAKWRAIAEVREASHLAHGISRFT